MLHLYLKAIHLIAVISWFAGLFYLGRMFVFHREAMDKPEPDRSVLIAQFNKMEWGVYQIIITPAMYVMWALGISMLVNTPAYLSQGWLHVKLTLVIGLTGYQYYMRHIIRQLEANNPIMNSKQFRLFNEVPTLVMVSVPLLAVLKDALNPIIVFGIVGALLILILWGVKKRMQAHK